jgi:protein-S-isoprenylcysteine O-methyltransferase Ste14
VVGVLLVAASILVLLESFVRFALQGGGTPAPVAPMRHLVVTGLYRHVRNPMYLAVASAIFGRSMILGSLSLLAYGGLVWFITNLFVLGYEEPTLRKTYGAEYEAFYANVPRWIPRFRPWTGSTTPR